MSDLHLEGARCHRCHSQMSAAVPLGLCTRCILLEALAAQPEAQASGELPLAVLPTERNALGQIGDYELIEMIGRGGMGVVFKARQVSTDRTVAVKLLPGGVHATEAVRQRLQQEFSAVTRLHHPNIVPIYELAERDGQLLCVMEYVAGRDLAQLSNGRPLPPQTAARYVSISARAVQYAHTQGVLHRDLKPSNILVGPDDQPRITDFDLAKEWDLNTNLTATGQVLGSPGYLPPEQVSVRSGTMGPPGDVYALGAVLYHLLTGRPPFLATTLADTLRQVLEDDPVPPGRLNGSVDDRLQTICLRCLEKDPGRRYATAQDLADDLDAFLEHRPVAARLPEIIHRLGHWPRLRQHPILRFLTLGLAIGGLLAAVLAAYLLLLVNRQRDANQDLRRQNTALAVATDRQSQQSEWWRYAGQLDRAVRAWDAGNPVVAREWLKDTSEKQRGWEFRYLQRLFHPELGTWTGHRRPLNAIACSPDGAQVACAGNGQIIRVWETASGKTIANLPRHRASVLTLAFLREGWLASGDESGVLIVWDPASWGEKRRWEWRSNAIECLAPAQEDGQIIAAYRDGSVRVWDLADDRPIIELAAHAGRAMAIAVPPRGLPPATGGEDGNIVLWDLERGTRLANFRGHQGMVEALAYTPDGAELVSGGHDGLVMIWDRESGQPKSVLRGHWAAVRAVDISPDGQWIASAGSDRSVRLWNRESGEPGPAWTSHGDDVIGLAFHPAGHWLFSASLDSTVKIWDADVNRRQGTPYFYSGGVAKMDFSPDSREFLTTGSDKALVRWIFEPAMVQQPMAPSTRTATSVAFSPDGKTVLTGNLDGTIRLLDAVTGDPQASFAGHTGAVRAVAFSRDAMTVASGGDDRTVRLWSLSPSTRQPLHTLAGHGNRITTVLFSPDGQRLYSAGWKDSVRTWDVKQGRFPSVLATSTSDVTSMDLSPDGRLLSVSIGAVVEIWDVQRGGLVTTLRGHTALVRSVAFSPDGRRLATSAEDHTVLLWEPASGQTVFTFPSLLSVVNKIRFSPDGNRLISASPQGLVYLWDATAANDPFSQASRPNEERVERDRAEDTPE